MSTSRVSPSVRLGTATAVAAPTRASPMPAMVQRCACGGSSGAGGKCAACEAEERFGRSPMQPKLIVGPADDPYEREADRVAAAVLRPGRTTPPSISRIGGEVGPLQPKAENRPAAVPAGFDAGLAGAGVGVPLSAPTRGFFEPRLGRDLGHVRLHRGGAADSLAGAIGARAFTRGSHVFVRSAEPKETRPEGLGLLAHELVHTVQQGAGGSGAVQRKGGTAGGFFANIGRAFEDLFTGSESDYPPEKLEEYLTELETGDAIVDDFDSDNKARAVVAKDLHKPKSVRVKILLMDEMLTGFVGDDDENAILKVLGDLSDAERETAAKVLGLERLHDKFDGEELDKLYVIYPVLDSLHPRRGDKSTTHSMRDYIDHWAAANGVTMSEAEKDVLARGCIGITVLEIGDFTDPDLSNCYRTFAEVLAARDKMQALLDTTAPDKKAIMFSKRFYMPSKPPADKTTGKVDMSGYDYSPRPGPDMTNFDYGLYDEKTGLWWHANHCDSTRLSDPDCGGPMKVYESTLEHYSRDLADFNQQIFCVAIAPRR